MRYSLPTPSQLRQHGDSLGIEMNDDYIAEVLDYVAPMAALSMCSRLRCAPRATLPTTKPIR